MKLLPVGYLSRAHGLKGHLVLKTESDFTDKINAFFLELNGSQAPYFVEELEPFKDGFIVKLEGVDSVETATKLKNCQVLAEEKFIVKAKAFELVGFRVVDVNRGEIGLIEELIDTPGNPLLRVMKGEAEILLPYHERFIEKVNKSKKELIYRAPEGLIEMYLP